MDHQYTLTHDTWIYPSVQGECAHGVTCSVIKLHVLIPFLLQGNLIPGYALHIDVLISQISTMIHYIACGGVYGHLTMIAIRCMGKVLSSDRIHSAYSSCYSEALAECGCSQL